MNYDFITRLSTVLRNNPDKAEDIHTSLTSNQRASKQWLVDTLKRIYPKDQAPTIWILGGWYGTFLVPMLQEAFPDGKITLNDLDSKTLQIAQQLHPDIQTSAFDVERSLAFLARQNIDILINTSMEHMNVSTRKLITANPRTMYVLQTCDSLRDPGHINPSVSVNEFADKNPLQTTLYKDRLNLQGKQRFMIIGYR